MRVTLNGTTAGREQIFGFTTNEPLSRTQLDLLLDVDSDADGVSDSTDNCCFVANPDQRDTDGDSIGNVCDADIQPVPLNDYQVNFGDLGVLKEAFFSASGAANWNPDADFDGDGAVNFADLLIMKNAFFGPPGPSCFLNACSE